MKDPRITELEQQLEDLKKRLALNADQAYTARLEEVVQEYVPPDSWVWRHLSDLKARCAG